MTYYEKVYKIVSLIPKGKVATYGQIAKLSGFPKRSRVIGYALHKNPYYGEVPCHRVVNRNGEISYSFAFGGEMEQRRLLEQEGIVFEENGKIKLEKYLWNPENLSEFKYE
ncbi:UNVERIFIED_CONTAM: methylated-DNA-protein-cysteine methyltransferase-like protein [Acetivibrio alkalicellulosi]